MPETTDTTQPAKNVDNVTSTEKNILSSPTNNSKNMHETQPQEPETSPSVEPTPSGKTGRWWGSLMVGAVFSIPLTWLLSYAASLPFFIGMFFFVLFGLIIGAVIYRVALKNVPYPSKPLIIGTTLLVLSIWSATIVIESHGFPTITARKIADKALTIGDQSVDEFRAGVAEQVRQFLRDQHPPGGIIGYVHWVLTDGVLQADDFEAINGTFTAPQVKFWWVIRAALSVGLLAFGIGSQTLSLKKPYNPSKKLVY